MAAGDTLTLCGGCQFWDHRGTREGLCRRHAPPACDRQLQVARWAETRAADSCGEGQPSAGEPAGEGQMCKGCRYWHRPGAGIDPGIRGDHLAAWWRQAGFCRRNAPRPGVDLGERGFWHITHESDHCFDGREA